MKNLIKSIRQKLANWSSNKENLKEFKEVLSTVTQDNHSSSFFNIIMNDGIISTSITIIGTSFRIEMSALGGIYIIYKHGETLETITLRENTKLMFRSPTVFINGVYKDGKLDTWTTHFS